MLWSQTRALSQHTQRTCKQTWLQMPYRRSVAAHNTEAPADDESASSFGARVTHPSAPLSALCPQEFQVSDIVADSYDVYTLLYYLNAKGSHDGVRDFLVHRLYKVDEEDIERVLPQLTHLFMIWSPDRSGPLGDYFSHLCSGSIHFTLKLIWTFRALQFHCPNRAQVECMERCVLNMEMSLINASVLENDGQMRPRRKDSGARKEKRDKARREADEAEARRAEEERMLQQGVDPATVASASGSHSARSSRESSRDSSPGRRLHAAGVGSALNPTSTTSRSRSLTPKGRRANHLPPPPSFVNSASVPGTASAGSAPTTSPLGASDASASPPGVLFRPDNSTPTEGVGSSEQKPQWSSSSSSSSSVEFHESTKPASAPDVSSSLVTHSASFSILSTSPSPPTPTAAAAAAAAAASSSEADSAVSSAASSTTTSPSNANASIALGAPTSPSAATASSADDQPTALVQSPGSYACSPAHASLLDELFLVYSKHVRSEYFNSIQRLMEGFGRISSSLVKLPVGPLRNKKLRASMRDLDASARGLYFPTDTPGNKHYRILRFLPSETFVLNSRDKAPFLFHFEVQYSRSSSVYEEDLYKCWRTHEEILAEAVKLAQCTKCAARNQQAVEHAQGKVSREARLTHRGDAPRHNAQGNPNPVATIQAAQSQMHSESNSSSAEAHPSVLAPGAELAASSDLQQLTSLSLQHADSSSSSSSLPAPLPSPSPPLTAALHGHRDTASSGRLVHTKSVPQEMVLMSAGSVEPATAAATSHPANVQLRAPSPMLEASSLTGRAHAADYSASSSSLITDALQYRDADGSASVVATSASASAPSPALGPSSSKRPSLSGHAGDWVLIPAAVPRPVALQNAFEQLSLQAFGESFSSRRRRIQASSVYYRSLRNTDVVSLIFKHGDDVRQEVMAMQFIRLAARIFADASLPLYLHTYCILITSPNSGLIETVKDSMSVDSLKKNVSATPHGATLASFFHYYFSMQGPEAHERALRNFIQSMAAYSVVSYLLQIKDRHNGNIMLSVERAGQWHPSSGRGDK